MKDKKEKLTILFPINASPPNIGHILAINAVLNIAKKVFVVIYDNPQTPLADMYIDVLINVLSNYKDIDKILILISPINFSTLNELPSSWQLPEIPYTIATTSRHIYSNLQSKGYPYLIFIKKPAGWRDEYYKIAFLRSMALYGTEVGNIEYRRRENNVKGKK